MAEQWTTASEDTITLLQEEIQRLENEVRLRDEALTQSAKPSEAATSPPDAELDRRFADLNQEVTKRDETIALLLEQVRLLEEAESATRAEWEQLNQWVEEVEKRVEGRDKEGRDLTGELDEERRKAEAQRLATETDRRTWETHRAALEKEVAQLREKLSEVARQPEGNARAAVEALEQENKRLRTTCRDLEKSKSVAAQAEYFQARFEEVQKELADVRQQLRQVTDERERERIEAETSLAELRGKLARDSARKREGEPVEQPAEQLTIDERIQALRLHLKEIHDREEEDRRNKRLSARLSRLWSHTAPRR
jgi:chromosome segregation ATPase